MPMKYQEAVREGKLLVASNDRNNWRLGEIADQLEPIYGDKTLERYSEDIGIAYVTLKNCRSTYRAWPHHNRRPQTWSVAKALVKYPDKYYVLEKHPQITVKEATILVDEYKKRKSVGKYRDMVVHKIISELCKKCNSFLDKDSPEHHMIKELIQYNETDFEYIQKVIEALHNARSRIDDAIKVITNPFY